MRRSSKKLSPESNATDQSTTLLDATREIFVREGLDGLSVRRVAEQAGCTTMVVYSRFGGKEGLIGAMFDEGFAALAEAQAEVAASLSPRVRVLELCRAYRRVAHDNPHHYALMLGTHSGSFTPGEASRAKAMGTLAYLVAAVGAALPARAGRSAKANAAASRIFAFCHGWAMLEQIGVLGDAVTEASFLHGIGALLDHA